LLFVQRMRLEKDTFGPVLRASRERRGITLRQMAAETKLGSDLWADLEDNNLSRWPRQIYARSYVRDYALRVGLDADDTVNEFCRLFPEWGDRRAERLLRRQAAIIDHDLDWEDLPAKGNRRASDHRPGLPTILGRHRARIFAACKANKIFFLNSMNATNVVDMIKEGVMIGSANQRAAEIGRQYTKREMPW